MANKLGGATHTPLDSPLSLALAKVIALSSPPRSALRSIRSIGGQRDMARFEGGIGVRLELGGQPTPRPLLRFDRHYDRVQLSQRSPTVPYEIIVKLILTLAHLILSCSATLVLHDTAPMSC